MGFFFGVGIRKLGRLARRIGTLDIRVGLFGKIQVKYFDSSANGEISRHEFRGTYKEVEWFLYKLCFKEWKKDMNRRWCRIFGLKAIEKGD